ncbi:MAG TPA: formimidoylglutamate deiminase [Ramlibacter sp.]|nr:formimidoylglutamate deiminase [Ramlibacter sp.]
MSADDVRRFFAPLAWVRGRWVHDVLLEADARGHWTRIAEGAGPADRTDTTLDGPVLPGLVNAHGHAFQRAIVGLTERSGGDGDDFWSWRDRMYSAANRMTPKQVEAVAAFLYAELLQAGYTHVCEFHYLHNDVDGKPYANALEMSQALVRAARRTGIGLTLLPTLYMRAGFAATGLRDDQRRFESSARSILDIAQTVRSSAIDPQLITAGAAIHSLRAVDKTALKEIAAAAKDMPVHLHIAEQRREVEDCLLEHGQRPLEFLMNQVQLDARWNLVHATQFTRDELTVLRGTGASVVICPSTEANLGDGIFELASWMGQSGNWSIGSDSHVTRSWREELRLLEYSQRLQSRTRNVAASAAVMQSSAAALFEGALFGGTAAAGLPLGGLRIGERADFVVVDPSAVELAGVPDDHLLDALVFSSPESRFSRVFVAGEEVLAGGERGEFESGFRAAMRELWR